MAFIKTLKDADKNIIYPQTHIEAVYDSNNVNLKEIHKKFVSAANGSEIEGIQNNYENVNNKTNVINENSTEIQYPSAKAVYDTILANKSTGISITIVESLPTENIDSNKIYLVNSSTTGSSSIYDEYLYVEERWELIGSTQVDLSNYYTKTEADSNYAKLSLYNDTTINIGRKSGTTIGVNSVAEGYNNTASGNQSHAEGMSAKAEGPESHAEGGDTTAIGSQSHAEGRGTIARKNQSHAEGNVTKAEGTCSHAEGQNTTASGDFSHAEGKDTTASGDFSHAEGSSTTASGNYSHAEGTGTIASGNSTHAEGQGAKANGIISHAEGWSTIASGEEQHVQGRFNIEDTSNQYSHIVGNGSITDRSNAHTLDWSGNAWFSGDVYTGSTSGTNKDDGSKKLATEEFVNNKIIASTTDIGAGVELADGIIYLVYEE